MELRKKNGFAKKLLALLLLLVTVVVMTPSITLAVDADSTIPYLVLSPDGTTITGFHYEAGVSPSEITIPAAIDGITITAIADSAFAGCGLTKVEFEAGSQIATIGDDAFRNNLFTEIALPTTVTSLGECVFEACSNLASIDLSGLSLETIPNRCFYQCGKLTTAILPEGLKTINRYAFFQCPLTGLVVPASVTTINGQSQFSAMVSGSVLDLTSHAPGSIAGAGWEGKNIIVRWNESGNDNTSIFVFNKDTGMICGIKEGYSGDGNIVIPTQIDGVTVVGLADGAFGSRPANQVIKTVTFEAGSAITSIPSQAFLGAYNLTAVNNIPDNVTSIGAYAFRYCRRLTSITLPSKLQTIETLAFRECAALESVTFTGDAITKIEKDVFGIDNNLKDIYLTQVEKDTVAESPWSAYYATIHWKNDTVLPQTVVDDSGLWEFSPATGAIVSYKGATGVDVDLVVPSKLSYGGNEYNISSVGVVGIRVLPSDSVLGSLTISDGILTIENLGFENVKIGALDLGTTIKTLDGSAFKNCGLSNIVLPESINTLRGSAFGDNKLTGEIVIPGNVANVSSDAFRNNPGITQITVQQYRTQASDGVFDPENEKYLLAPAAVRNTSPFGATHIADNVYFMDDPRPLYTYNIITDPVANTATIELTVIMSNQTVIHAIDSATGMPALNGTSIASTGNNSSSTNMLVPSAKGNGDYTFVTTFAYGAKTHQYSVPVDVFHNITFDENGATGGTVPTDATNYVENYNIASLPGNTGNLVKSHCEFLGWSTTQSAVLTNAADAPTLLTSYTMGDEDVTLYAVWLMGPSVPADYTFPVPAKTLSGTLPSGFDETFTATIEAQGTAPAPTTASGTVDMTSATTANFSAFSGVQFTEVGTYVYKVTETTGTANGVTYDKSEYTITIVVADVEVSGVWTLVATPTITKTKDANGDPIASPQTVTTIGFSNSYALSSFTVTYEEGSGPASVSGMPSQLVQTYIYNVTVDVAAAPTSTTHDFTGWLNDVDGKTYKTGTALASFAMPGQNVTLTAQWTPKSFTVTYDAGAGAQGVSGMPSPLAQTHTYNSTVSVAAAPTSTTHDFTGWLNDVDGKTYKTGTALASFAMPGQNVTLTAQWTPKSFTVTYDAGTGAQGVSGMPDPLAQTHTYNSTVDVAAAPTSTTHDFTGWLNNVDGKTYKTGTALASFAMPGQNVTLTAQWKSKTYTVSFDSQGGSAVAPIADVPYGSTIAAPQSPTFDGFRFKGWFTDASCTTAWNFGSGVVTGDMTLYAKWVVYTPDFVTVTFEYNDGRGVYTTVTVSYGDGQNGLRSYMPANPTGSSAFGGWNCSPDGSGAGFTANTAVTSDITVYAQWNNSDGYYTLSFNLNGALGTTPRAQSLRAGSLATAVAAPERAGYTFEGWNTAADGSGDNWDFASTKMPARNVTLYAQWSGDGNTTSEPTRTTTNTAGSSQPSGGDGSNITVSSGGAVVPLVVGNTHWALANLILAVVGVVVALVTLLMFLVRKKEETVEDENGYEVVQEYKKHGGLKVLSALIAAISVVVFIVTENMRLPMGFMDKWTILMVVLFVGQLLVTIFGKRSKRGSDDEDGGAEIYG